MLAAVIIIGSGAGFYFFRKQQAQALADQKRVEGVAAYNEERYFDAMHALGSYVLTDPTDSEALFLYAKARMEVEEADGRSHLLNALGVLRDVVALDPDNLEAKQRLLELYSVFGYAPEAVDLADEVLAVSPDDSEAWSRKMVALNALRRFEDVVVAADEVLAADPPRPEPLVIEAMRARASALLRLERSSEGLTQAIELNLTAPDDFRAYLLTLEAMRAEERPRTEVITWAESVYQSYPDVEGTALLAALAHSGPEGREASLAWLRREVEADPESLVVVRLLIRELGRKGQLLATIDLARDLQERSPSMQYEHVLLSHLLFAGRAEEVVSLTDRYVDDSSRASLRSLAYRAQALFELGRDEEGAALVESFSSRTNDSMALAYGAILRQVYVEDDVEPMRILETSETALSRDPGNPMFAYWRGNAFSALGESDRAIELWNQAAQIAPSWDAPLLAVSRELSRAGRHLEAYPFAALVLQRSPRNLAANVNLIATVGPVLDRIPQRDRAQLLALSRSLLDTQTPNHPDVLPVYMRLLMENERRGEVEAEIEGLLKSSEAIATATLLRVAEVSAEFGLGYESALMARADGAAAETPEMVAARALVLHRDGRTEEALALLDAEVAEAEGTEALLAMRTGRATVLDRMGDARAREAWASLVEDYSDNVRVIQRALESESFWSDEAATRGAIDTLRGLTDENSLGWRTAEARWLLTYGGREDLPRARSMLDEITNESPGLVRPRLMLAEALNRLGDTDGAINQIERAKGLRGGDVTLDLLQARLLRGADRALDATRVYETLATQPDALSAEQQREVAVSLADLGRLPLAVSMVETMIAASGSVSDRLLLAQMYERGEDTAAAERVYTRLLAGEPRLDVLGNVPRFYQSIGQDASGRAALERLDEVPDISPVAALVVRGDYARRGGNWQDAEALFAEAAELDPTRAGVWLRLISSRMNGGESGPVLEALDRGLAANPGDPTLVFLDEQRVLIENLVSNAGLRPMMLQMVESPDTREVAADILRAAYEIDRDGGGAVALIPRFQRIVREHPNYLPAHMILAQSLASLDRTEEAVTVAMQAVRTFPDSPDPAGMATELLAAQGKWAESRNMGLQWRRRLANPLVADLRIARAMIEMGTPNQASTQIQPYLQDAMRRPLQLGEVLLVWATARIEMGRAEEARLTLRPLLAPHPGWRESWIQLATQRIEDEAEAMRWMEVLIEEVEEDDADSRLQIAIGLRAVGSKFNDAGMLDRAREMMRALAAEGEASPRAVLSMAIMDDTEGRQEEAEAGYRRVLEMVEDQPVALNNLAMVLQRKGQASEAISLAERAIRQAPSFPAFRNTLTLSLLADGQVEAALEQANLLNRLDPSNLEWQLTLAEALAMASRKVEAQDTLGFIDRAIANGREVDEDFRERLESIRAMVEEIPAERLDANAGVFVP